MGNSGAVRSREGSGNCHSLRDLSCCCSNQEPCHTLVYGTSCAAVCITCHLGLWKIGFKVIQFLCMNSEVGIMFVHHVVCICSLFLLMWSGPCGLLRRAAFFTLNTSFWGLSFKMEIHGPVHWLYRELTWEQQDHIKDQILFVEGLHLLPNMWHGLVLNTYRIYLSQDRHLTVGWHSGLSWETALGIWSNKTFWLVSSLS